MDKQLIGTGNLWETDYPYTKGGPAPWTPVVKVRMKDAYLVLLAGQVAYDEKGRIVVPDSMKAQAELTYKNIAQALQAAGAKISDIIYERAFVRQEFMRDYMVYGARTRAKFYQEAGVTQLPPFTLLGISRLSHNDQVLEVEIMAVTEAK